MTGNRLALSAMLDGLSAGDLLAVRTELARRVAARRWHSWKPYPWQVPPPNIPTLGMWLMLGGRGTGKTDGSARYVLEHVKGPPCDRRVPGGHRIGIVAPTMGDAVESCVTGPSGLKTHEPDCRLTTGLGGTHIYFPGGAVAKLFGAYTKEDQERLRAGGNRCLIWMEEMAAMRYLSAALDHTMFGLRIGPNPHYIASTTPKARPEIRALLEDRHCLVTRGRTRDAHHLDKDFRDKVIAKYEGTYLGAQELDGKVLRDVQGALWKFADIEATRIKLSERPEMTRITIGVDPNASEKSSADMFGIVAAGRGVDGDIYVLEDASQQLTGEPACRAVWLLWWRLGGTAEVVYEGNKGGVWVGKALRETWLMMRKEGYFAGAYGHPPIVEVTASEDKATRAVPIAMLYQVLRMHHVGILEQLEVEQTTWVPSVPGQPKLKSPNRLDALVWAGIRLEQAGAGSQVSGPQRTAPGRIPVMPSGPKFGGLGALPSNRPGPRRR